MQFEKARRAAKAHTTCIVGPLSRFLVVLLAVAMSLAPPAAVLAQQPAKTGMQAPAVVRARADEDGAVRPFQVKEAVEAVAPVAYAKRVHVVKRLGSAPGELYGDPVRLRRALVNLLSNAIKFTPAGGAVTISLEACGRHHTITVSDTGEGIEPGFLPFVFDHYRQAERADGTGGGLGLGLAIARHIVELHDGRITAHSRGPGEGAVFTVQLPREPTPHPQGGSSK